MDYSKLNLTRLKEQLKERCIDGRSKLTTRDMIVSVLKFHDTNPNDKEGMRRLVSSLLKPVVPTSPKPLQNKLIQPRLATSFDSIYEPVMPKLGLEPVTETLTTKQTQPSVLDLTNDEWVHKVDSILNKSRQNLAEYRKIKQEVKEESIKETHFTQPTVRLEIPKSDYDRLCKIVANYEKSRMKSRENAQKKSEKEREEKNAKFVQAGLMDYVKKTKQREPLVKELNLNDYVIHQ